MTEATYTSLRTAKLGLELHEFLHHVSIVRGIVAGYCEHLHSKSVPLVML